MEAPLIPGTLDSQFACWQALYQQMFDRGHAVVPDAANILRQDAAPAPEDRATKGWVPTAGGIPIFPGGGVFWWHPVVGHWVARPYKAAGDPRPEMFIGDLATLPTFDGGDAGAPGIASGPMWEVWGAIEGRVPIGVGTIPTSAPAATVALLATSDSNTLSGEYKHTLTEAEGAVGNHQHAMGVCDPATDDGFFAIENSRATSNYTGHYITGSGSTPATAENSANLISLAANDGAGVVSDPHLNMQPYIGVYWIKRTALREFYIAG